MRAIHVIAASLVIAAIALAFAGLTDAAFGVFCFSTLLELAGSIITGKSRNT